MKIYLTLIIIFIFYQNNLHNNGYNIRYIGPTSAQ